MTGAGTAHLDRGLTLTLTHPRRLAVLVLLMALTALAVQLCPPYRAYGPELLQDPDFRQGLTHWRQVGPGEVRLTDGVVELHAADNATSLKLVQTLDPGAHRYLALSGELAARNLVPGDRPWQRGRLVLTSLDGEGRRIPGPDRVLDLAGTQGWQYGQAVLPVPEQARTLAIQAQLLKSTGELRLRNISLRQARPNPGYQGLRAVLALTWVAGVVWLTWPLLARLRSRSLNPFVIGMVVAILAGTLLPGSLKAVVETGLIQGLDPLWPAALPLTVDLIDRCGHFVFFALLAGGLVLAGLPRTWRLLMLLMLFAAATEVLQLLVEGRMPSLADLAFDCAGLVTGLILVNLGRMALAGTFARAPNSGDTGRKGAGVE